MYDGAMSLDDLSRRVSLALGLGALLACEKPKEPATEGKDVAAPITSEAVAPSAVPSTSSAPTAPSAVGVAPVGPGNPLAGHGCGFEIVCVPRPGKVAVDHAPAPFERCAAELPAEKERALGAAKFDAELTKTRFSSSPTCCYKAPRQLCGGGRPFVVADRPRLPPLVARDGFALDVPAPPAPRDLVLAARHLSDARSEHASVASFARVSLLLLAFGAPPALLADVHAAALDEIDHARPFVALASRRGAGALGPGPLSIAGTSVDTDLASFVRETVRDGCVAEARALLDLEERAASPELDTFEKVQFARIAADEAMHVALSWRLVGWALDAYPDSARPALRAALAALVDDPDPLVTTIVIPAARALLARSGAPAATPATLPSPTCV